MAQERYGFFDSAGGDIRSYSAADMATAFHALASDGVANLGSCLQVTAEGSTMRTLVGYGAAMVGGYYYQLRDDGSGVRAFTHATEAELGRIDRIVLRLDLAARTITLVKKTGTAAATPQAPALTRDGETVELALARVRVRAGAQEVLPTDITDERDDDAVCGLIAPESLRRSAIQQMIGAETADVVRCTQQSLTESGQAQARANINAADADDARIKTYHAVEDIGLAFSFDLTLEDICGALPDGSMLLHTCLLEVTTNLSPAEERLGSLVVIKLSTGRFSVMFYPKQNNDLWRNYVYLDGSAYIVGTWVKLSPVHEVSAVLVAASWGGSGPYTQAVAIAGMTANAKAVFGLPQTATGAQYGEAAEALLRVTSQGDNTVTITAEGYKPAVDIPILIQVVG